MGPFLFDGVVRCTRAGHEAGKAEAIAALCKVRVSHPRYSNLCVCVYVDMCESFVSSLHLRLLIRRNVMASD